jgi:predicted phosphoribosyltransferase
VARVIAIIFATLSALAQFGIVTAFPLWAILIITLDVIVIYQLAVNWEEKLAPLR